MRRETRPWLPFLVAWVLASQAPSWSFTLSSLASEPWMRACHDHTPKVKPDTTLTPRPPSHPTPPYQLPLPQSHPCPTKPHSTLGSPLLLPVTPGIANPLWEFSWLFMSKVQLKGNGGAINREHLGEGMESPAAVSSLSRLRGASGISTCLVNNSPVPG